MNEWKNIKIGDVGKIVTGSTPPTSDKENYGNDYSWVSPADLGKTKYIENTLTKLSKKGFDKTRKIPAKSILVTCIGSTIGKMGMTKIEMSTNQQINSIIVNKEVYDENFIYYCINYNFPKFLNKIASQAVPIISKSEFEKLEIKAPSLVEQIKIGTILNLLDKKIELQSKKIEALKLYKKGLLISCFKDKIRNTSIKELIFIGKAGGTPKSTIQEYYDGNIPFLSISDISGQNKYITYTEKKVSKKGLNSSSAWIVPKNSVILSMYASYGLPCINKIELCTSQAMYSMIFKDNVINEYVYYYLFYLNQIKFYDSLVSTGTQPNLNADKINKIKIYLPTKEEQIHISNNFQNTDKKINLEFKKLNKLQKLKKGLMQSMFV